MADYEISGWIPKWTPAADQIELQRVRLRECKGRTIVDSWLVWNVERDAWFPDLPVALCFDNGVQLEVCWQKFDDLSVSWNTIDFSVAPIAWMEDPLEWRSSAHPSLRPVIGSTITAVASTEHRFTTRPVGHRLGSAEERSTWLVGGLLFSTNKVPLHIFNALDENGISNDPVTKDSDNRLQLL